ncbi:MAG: TlyA family RNA methyltransferase [Clostridiales bacterium]|nr:TlyA family RNA methyltransferase [Clostridiales bacterium]
MKERLDILLVQRALAPSREKAKALIMAGEVLVDGQREDKAGTMIDTNAAITVKGGKLRYVSRGGLKLEKAMQTFEGITPEGKVCMDVGSSTGGFTDCMLQNGAQKVYAVDVGHGQLDWGLRNDPRVVCMERTNIRYVVPEDIEEAPAFVSIDVSFISLKKVLTPVRNLMAETGDIVCLIKPQFEAGREKVGKKGVVRDPKVHEEVIRSVIAYAAEIGLPACALTYSPVKGPEGNIEYLVWLKKHGRKQTGENVDGCGAVSADVISGSFVSIGETEALTASDSVRSVTDRDVLRVVAEAHAALD